MAFNVMRQHAQGSQGTCVSKAKRRSKVETGKGMKLLTPTRRKTIESNAFACPFLSFAYSSVREQDRDSDIR